MEILQVIQFHDNPHGERTEILLGLFNLDIHKHWIDDNPQKKPLKVTFFTCTEMITFMI